MNQDWKRIKVPLNQRSLIWIFLKNLSKQRPLIVLQTNPGEDLKLNFKEDLINIEVEKI